MEWPPGPPRLPGPSEDDEEHGAVAELLDIENERTLSREEAAAWLRELADQLARNNQLQLRREGLKYTVRVPAEVTMEVEIEVEDDGGKVEVEISW